MVKSGEKKVIKAGIGYTVANILIKGLAFLTLPLFSRIMTTDQFGAYNIFISYETLLTIIIGFAIHSSIKSANLRYKDKINEYTASVSLIYVLSGIIWMILALFFNQSISQWMEMNRTVVPLLVVYSFGNAVIMLYNNRVSLDYAYKKYLSIALFNALGNIILSIVCMYTFFTCERDVGRIVGASISIFILSIIVLYKIYKKAKPHFNYIYWKFALDFSLPMVPHGISQVLLGQFDRIMIQKFCGNSAAGIFSLAGNIKMIAIVLIDSLITTWGVWFFDKMAKREIQKIQRRAIQLCMLFCILSIGLIMISPELIFILGGEEYEAGKYVAVPMVIDAFLVFVYSIIVQGEYYKNKTMFVMTGTMLAAGLDIALNLVFIPKFGFIAAAYTTLVAYVCYLFLHCLISKFLIGFYIVPLKWLLFFSGILAIFALLTLYIINDLMLRWTFGFVTIGILVLFGIKKLSMIINR